MMGGSLEVRGGLRMALLDTDRVFLLGLAGF